MDRISDMVDNASRRGAVDLALPLMLTAFVVIGVFMWWLKGQAAAERELRLVMDTVTVENDDFGTATTVPAVDLQTDPTPFEGLNIRVAGLTVASALGTQGFWLQLPNRNPFLVSMSEQVMAEGLDLPQGIPATVIGVLHAVNDSVLTAWEGAGTITDGDRLAAEFATHFLEATDVVVGNAPDASDGNDGN
jgi:hypothetical protein